MLLDPISKEKATTTIICGLNESKIGENDITTRYVGVKL
jgi:hypothetical protein